jgi:UDP-N-acetylglucosamine--N-acetylmuramyl-(pentapeptide) pyrophosphoryl-undecaprenol N-acetylglucosamine transferase
VNVVVAGGGTAGHVFPAVAVAGELRDRGADVTFVGAADGQEAELVPAAGYPFVPVHAISAQTRMSLRSAKAVALAVRASRAVRPLVARADVVIGIGGFASAPGALAARSTGRPLVLIEQNSVPGAVNRIAARWAGAVATTFEATARQLPRGPRIERTGNPIRREIAEIPARRAEFRRAAEDAFSLDAERRTVLVVGGSQGALHLDEVVAEALPLLEARDDLQLLVSTGRGHEAVVAGAAAAARIPVRVVPFIERMELALAVADLAVSRSGASVAELAAAGLPAILVPYPHATENHQESNAREVMHAGAATILLDAELTAERLASGILALMDDHGRRRAMGSAARAWARPDAAERIADLVVEIAT